MTRPCAFCGDPTAGGVHSRGDRRVRNPASLYRGILVAARRGRCSASARVYRFGNGPEVLDGAICGVAAMEGPGGCYDPAMTAKRFG